MVKGSEASGLSTYCLPPLGLGEWSVPRSAVQDGVGRPPTDGEAVRRDRCVLSDEAHPCGDNVEFSPTCHRRAHGEREPAPTVESTGRHPELRAPHALTPFSS